MHLWLKSLGPTLQRYNTIQQFSKHFCQSENTDLTEEKMVKRAQPKKSTVPGSTTSKWFLEKACPLISIKNLTGNIKWHKF
jgi:hypothetical protein